MRTPTPRRSAPSSTKYIYVLVCSENNVRFVIVYFEPIVLTVKTHSNGPKLSVALKKGILYTCKILMDSIFLIQRSFITSNVIRGGHQYVSRRCKSRK